MMICAVMMYRARPAWRRTAWLLVALLLASLIIGCGETYRPIAQPLPGSSPSPAAVHFVYSIATDGGAASTSNPGSVSRIDVSGESVASIIATGAIPVHGALTPSAASVYIANSGDDTVSVASTSSINPATAIDLAAPPVTIIQAVGNGSTATYTYSGASNAFLPGQQVLVSGCATPGFNGVFTVTAVSPNTFSVANSTSASDSPEANTAAAHSHPDPIFVNTTEGAKVYVADFGTGTISVINTPTNTVINTVSVDATMPLTNIVARPIVLTEMPNGQKLYSLNVGNNTVTSINTVDDSIAHVVQLKAPPVGAVASADSAYVFVLDQSGTISTLATASDAIVSTASAGAGANFIFYDKVFNRLFVTNPATSTLGEFDVLGNTVVPHSVGSVTIVAATGSACISAIKPTSVTVLGDGSRAYVASYQRDPGGAVCGQVDVISAATVTNTKTLSLPQATDLSSQTGCSSVQFPVFAVSSGGGANSNFSVYVSQCDSGTVTAINTYAVSTGPDTNLPDSIVATLPAPVSSFLSAQVSVTGASQAGVSTTYDYQQLAGPPLRVGMGVVINGMTDPGNNGFFEITALSTTPTTFTVTNRTGVSTGNNSQNGSGTVLALQNPVFLLAGP